MVPRRKLGLRESGLVGDMNLKRIYYLSLKESSLPTGDRNWGFGEINHKGFPQCYALITHGVVDQL